MDASFDVIFLGTGHNALVAQAYLARCGLRTLAVDRARVAGGGLATVENPRCPGFFHPAHSFFHRAVTAMPWYRDLELARHGARYVEPELNVAVLFEDGRVLEWWTDLERTVASCARFSPRDAAALERWALEFAPILEGILLPEALSPPLEPARRSELLRGSRLGRRLLEVAALSPLEFVRREFADDRVRAGLLFFNGLREIDPTLAGFGHAIPALLASPHKAQVCLGGPRRLAEALVGDISEHGGEVRTGAPLRGLIVERRRVVGVALAGGERVRAARAVVSGLNPQQTFADLCAAADVPEGLAARARAFRYNDLAPLFALHLALREPPRYAIPRADADAAPLMVVLGLDGTAQFERIVAAHARGELPPLVAWGSCPTLFDSSQAPPGRHTAFLWEKVPFALHGDPQGWRDAGERHAEAVLELWCRHAPNLAAGAVVDRWFMTPLDTVRALPNMARGDLLVGSFAAGQVGYNRPFPGAGHYRTPLAGLYLCGASTHPGGNITGLCGYNAASVLAADLGLERWWNPPSAAEALARCP